MIKRTSQPLCVWFICSDLVLTLLAWVAAYALRFQSGLFVITKDVPDFTLCLNYVPLIAVFSAISYRIVGQYEIPVDAKEGVWKFSVKVAKLGLTGTSSNELKVAPLLKLTNAKWDTAEAKHGDILKMTCDVKNANAGDPVEIEVLQNDARGAHVPLVKLLTVVKDNKAELSWELRPALKHVANDTGSKSKLDYADLEQEYFFKMRIGAVEAKSANVKLKAPGPKAELKWSKKEVTPNHNSAWPPATAPTDAVPEEAKVEVKLDTKNIPDETAVVIEVRHCKTGALVPLGKL